MDADLETQQGKTLADACKEANVERFIFSSLPYVSKGNHVPNSRRIVAHYLRSFRRKTDPRPSL